MTVHEKHAFSAAGARFYRAVSDRDAAEAASSGVRLDGEPRQAPRPATEGERLRALAVVANSKMRVAAALSHPCAEHDAEPGDYCWASNGVKGICQPRFDLGIRSSGGVAATVRLLAVPRRPASALDFRHPNRHPMTPVRTAVAR